MKEIMTLIRRHKVPETKKAFEDAGFPALTIQSVEGRGKQGGIGGWAAEVDPELNAYMSKGLGADETKFNWIPKRMLVSNATLELAFDRLPSKTVRACQSGLIV